MRSEAVISVLLSSGGRAPHLRTGGGLVDLSLLGLPPADVQLPRLATRLRGSLADGR